MKLFLHLNFIKGYIHYTPKLNILSFFSLMSILKDH